MNLTPPKKHFALYYILWEDREKRKLPKRVIETLWERVLHRVSPSSK